MKGQLRKSGIDVIGDIPWGTHICQFYHTKEDLIDILIPYFKAGLENNEFCMWVTSQPVEVKDAKEALRKAIPDFNTYLEKGQIEIIPYTDWFITGGIFDSKRVSNSRFEKLNHALDNGYDGMRLSGNTTWLEKESWNSFIGFKEQTDKAMDTYKMINLCTYFLDRHNTAEIIDVVVNHQFALIKREGKWNSIESPKRKMAEETAIQATKNWDYTFDAVPDLIAILDTEYRIIRANRALAARLGIKPEECGGLTCYRAIHGTDEPPSFCPHRQLLMDELEHTREVHEESLGGDFIVSVSPLHNSEGKLTGCIYVARDITERKRAEEALRESEERLCFALETSHTGAWDLDLVDHTAYRSLEHDRIFGYEQLLPEWTYEMFLDHVLPEDRATVDTKFREATTALSDWSFECRIRRVDGAVRWIWAAGRHRVDSTGSARRMAGIVQDITERKEAEKELYESEKRFRTLSENSPDIIARFNKQNRHMYANPAAAEPTGRSPEEIIGKTNSELGMDPEQVKFWEGHYENVFTTGKPETMEFQYISPQGKEYYFNTQIVPEFVDSKVTSVLAISHDITDIKEAESRLKDTLDNLENLVKERTVELEKAYELLKESEKGLAEAQKMAHIGNWEWDIEADKAYWSEEMYRIFGRDPQESAPSYKEYLSYIHPDDRDYYCNAIKKAVKGKPFDIDYRIVLANGEERTVHLTSEFVSDNKNIPVRIKGVVQDITERKKAEKALVNLEIARKKEIHHRIKNNLQVISSLLDLQADNFRGREYVGDSEVLNAFRESQNRVISIALIHEELHEGGRTDTLNFPQYLQRLIENLFLTYTLGNADISLNIDLEEDTFFDMDTAVPLGLIVNELISNSFKYAFQGRDKGIIQIKLNREENGELINNRQGNKEKRHEKTIFALTVSDNGIGMPESFNLENSDTLGIQLVTTLVDQLDGELELKKGSGTEFIIRFAVAEKK